MIMKLPIISKTKINRKRLMGGVSAENSAVKLLNKFNTSYRQLNEVSNTTINLNIRFG